MINQFTDNQNGEKKRSFRPTQLRIGEVCVNFPVVPAPMAGVTDKPYRDIVRQFGVELTFTEMVSSEALIRKNCKTFELFNTAREEWPLVVQIFGSKPDVLANAAKIVENEGAAIIDINAGCPVKKIVRQGAGAALLKTPNTLANIITEVKRTVKLPVTLKIRSGWDKNTINAVEISKLAEDSGIDAITLHPRTATQLFGGHADWNIIKQVRKHVKLPVIGNGDIKTPEDVLRMFKSTGCHAIMIGRASIGNPWIFEQIRTFFIKNKYQKPGLEEIELTGITHFEKVLEFYGPRGLPYAKTVLIRYVKYLPKARESRNTIYSLNSPEDIERFWREYFSWLKQRRNQQQLEEENIESNCS